MAGIIICHEFQKGLCVHATNARLVFEMSSNSSISECIVK